MPDRKNDSQTITDFKALYQQAIESESLYATQVNAYLDYMKERYPGTFAGVIFEQGPLKTPERALEKINGDYEGHPEKIADLVRGRFVVQTAEQADILRRELDSGYTPFTVEKFKDQFGIPTDTHFRAINTKIRLSNGHLVEFRVEHEVMLTAALDSHEPYERIQAIERLAKQEHRDLTASEERMKADLLDEVRFIHNNAAAEANLDELLNEGRASVDAFKARWEQRAAQDSWDILSNVRRLDSEGHSKPTPVQPAYLFVPQQAQAFFSTLMPVGLEEMMAKDGRPLIGTGGIVNEAAGQLWDKLKQSTTQLFTPIVVNPGDVREHSGTNVSIHGMGHVVQAGSIAMSVLAVRSVVEDFKAGKGVSVNEILIAGLGATDGVASAMNMGFDDLAIMMTKNATKLSGASNAAGRFGIIGTVITSAPELWKAHSEGNAGDKGAAWAQLTGGVAVTAVGVTASIAAAPLIVAAIPLVDGARAVGAPIGKLFSDDPKERAAGEKELAEMAERYNRPLTGTVDLAGQAVHSLGSAAKGLGDGVAWAGEQYLALGKVGVGVIDESGLPTFMKTGLKAAVATQTETGAVVLKVAGRTVQTAGYVMETAGHVTSRVADEMGKAIRDEQQKEGMLIGSFTGVAKGAGAVVEKASPYLERKAGEIQAAYGEYMPTWLGGDEPKPEKPKEATQASTTAGKPVAGRGMNEKEIDAGLTKLMPALKEGKWGGRIGNGDADFDLVEFKNTLSANGVKIGDLDKNGDGQISGSEITTVLYTIPKVTKPEVASK